MGGGVTVIVNVLGDLRDASEIRSNRGTVRHADTCEHVIYNKKSGETSGRKVLVIQDKEVRNSLYIVEPEKIGECIWGYRGATGMPVDEK